MIIRYSTCTVLSSADDNSVQHLHRTIISQCKCLIIRVQGLKFNRIYGARRLQGFVTWPANSIQFLFKRQTGFMLFLWWCRFKIKKGNETVILFLQSRSFEPFLTHLKSRQTVPLARHYLQWREYFSGYTSFVAGMEKRKDRATCL
jgi:hypothetical protein